MRGSGRVWIWCGVREGPQRILGVRCLGSWTRPLLTTVGRDVAGEGAGAAPVQPELDQVVIGVPAWLGAGPGPGPAAPEPARFRDGSCAAPQEAYYAGGMICPACLHPHHLLSSIVAVALSSAPLVARAMDFSSHRDGGTVMIVAAG